MPDNENKKVSENAGIAAEEHVTAASDEMEKTVDEMADGAVNEAECSNGSEQKAEASASENDAKNAEESGEEASADAEENVGRADAEAAETGKKGRKKDKKKKEKGAGAAAFKNSFRTKDFRFGMYSSALTAVVIVAVVVVNVLAAHLPGSLNSIDMSSNNITSIGSQTEKLLDSLDEDVTISVLASEDSADANINALLEKYKKASKHITVKYIDTSTDLGASQTYSNYSANSVIVACGDKESVIDYYDIYQQDYSSYYTTGQASTSFDGEGQITSAINKVTAENAQTLYCLTGHGETALGTSASSMISKQNMIVSDLNLLASDIPDDCSAVIINGATDDLSADEATKLTDYIKNGGSVMVLLAYTDESQPNLDSVINAYGVQRANGNAIAMETSGNSYNYPINIIAGIESTDITSDLASEKANIIMTNAIALKTTDADAVTVTDLLTSSDGAYAKVPQNGQLTTLEKESGDVSGPFVYAVMSEDDAEGGKLAVVASQTLLEDQITQSLPVGNLEFFVNCLADMCGESGVNAVSIEAKSMDIEYMTIPALHSMIWMAVCVVLIPLIIFISGLVVWLTRRKR